MNKKIIAERNRMTSFRSFGPLKLELQYSLLNSVTRRRPHSYLFISFTSSRSSAIGIYICMSPQVIITRRMQGFQWLVLSLGNLVNFRKTSSPCRLESFSYAEKQEKYKSKCHRRCPRGDVRSQVKKTLLMFLRIRK